MRLRWFTIARIAQTFSLLIASVTMVIPAETLALPSHRAQCGDDVVTTGLTIASEEILTTTALGIPPGNRVRTTAQLTVPTGAQWDGCLASGSLLLTVTFGVLHVVMADGAARVAPELGSELGVPSLRELATDEAKILGPGNRLVVHGHGMLVARNVGQGVAVAEVIRVS